MLCLTAQDFRRTKLQMCQQPHAYPCSRYLARAHILDAPNYTLGIGVWRDVMHVTHVMRCDEMCVMGCGACDAGSWGLTLGGGVG